MVNFLGYVVIGFGVLLVLLALYASMANYGNNLIQTAAVCVGVCAFPCIALAILALFHDDGLFGYSAGSWLWNAVKAFGGGIVLGWLGRR